MAQPSSSSLVNSVSVVSSQFCTPYPVDLVITRKFSAFKHGEFGVTDVNGNLMFKLKGSFSSTHSRHVLFDAGGNPIITQQQKLLTYHRRWQVFRGESTDSRDLLFSVKRSSMFQWKSKFDVFLASNTSEDVCDFKVKASWNERSCVVYAGESSTVVAQMHKKSSVRSFLHGKDEFIVTVYPNVDYAFIVSLVVILDKIYRPRG